MPNNAVVVTIKILLVLISVASFWLGYCMYCCPSLVLKDATDINPKYRLSDLIGSSFLQYLSICVVMLIECDEGGNFRL